jgi:hypothetical protein
MVERRQFIYRKCLQLWILWNFGLFLASSVASVDESCTKNEKKQISRFKVFLQLLFSSSFCRTRFNDIKPFWKRGRTESCLANIRLANSNGHISRTPQLALLALAPGQHSTGSEKVWNGNTLFVTSRESRLANTAVPILELEVRLANHVSHIANTAVE